MTLVFHERDPYSLCSARLIFNMFRVRCTPLCSLSWILRTLALLYHFTIETLSLEVYYLPCEVCHLPCGVCVSLIFLLLHNVLLFFIQPPFAHWTIVLCIGLSVSIQHPLTTKVCGGFKSVSFLNQDFPLKYFDACLEPVPLGGCMIPSLKVWHLSCVIQV